MYPRSQVLQFPRNVVLVLTDDLVNHLFCGKIVCYCQYWRIVHFRDGVQRTLRFGHRCAVEAQTYFVLFIYMDNYLYIPLLDFSISFNFSVEEMGIREKFGNELNRDEVSKSQEIKG